MRAEDKLTAVDFFAGSGLVSEGLNPYFQTLWANDICDKKALVYRANFPDVQWDGRSIAEVRGSDVPAAHLAWASFPCQDLSIAGDMRGISGGTRSALFWEWIRVLYLF